MKSEEHNDKGVVDFHKERDIRLIAKHLRSCEPEFVSALRRELSIKDSELSKLDDSRSRKQTIAWFKEVVSQVSPLGSNADLSPESKERRNKRILELLRDLDYVSRDKLTLLMLGLHKEQRESRPQNSSFCERLDGLLELIPEVEADAAREIFDERLSAAIDRASRQELEAFIDEHIGPTEETPEDSEIATELPSGPATMESVEQWLHERSFREKLTFVLVNSLSFGDPGEQELFNEIRGGFERHILSAASDPKLDLPAEDRTMTTVAMELLHCYESYSR